MHPYYTMMRSLLTLTCLLLAPFAVANADCGVNCCPECDRINRLPGYDSPLPSPWYSGYLTYTLENYTIHTHYVLVMAERMHGEEEAEQAKPMIYWSNGGPGASSLFGLLTEVGPLWLNEDSFDKHSSLPKPIYNPYGWTRLGHVMMIDQPAPVGFSYCEEDEKCSDISWTDELAAENVSCGGIWMGQAMRLILSDIICSGFPWLVFVPELSCHGGLLPKISPPARN